MMNQSPPDFREAALRELEQRQREQWQQDQDAQQRQRQAQRQDAAAQLQQFEQQQVNAYAQLVPLYAQRQEAARRGEILKFWQIEQAIRAAERPIDNALENAWGGRLWPDEKDQRRGAIRIAAGLPQRHEELGLATPSNEGEWLIACTMYAVMTGVVSARGVGIPGQYFVPIEQIIAQIGL